MLPIKVSSIVSAYYADRFLQDRLENLYDQGVAQEIIVVCQSKSKEEAIARSFQERHLELVHDETLRIFPTADIPTVYAAWNIGISYARGEYITNANSDDAFKFGALSEMASILDEKKDHALVYGDIERIEQVGGPVTGLFQWREGGLKELVNEGCFLGPMPMWRKSLHDKYGLFLHSFKVAGDYEFWMRLAAGGEKFYHIRHVVGVHLERQDALEHKAPVNTVWEIARAKARYRSTVERM